jgi:hypothetical protein
LSLADDESLRPPPAPCKIAAGSRSIAQAITTSNRRLLGADKETANFIVVIKKIKTAG